MIDFLEKIDDLFEQCDDNELVEKCDDFDLCEKCDG